MQEYDESEKMSFSVLSAGKAADAGVWTIIGANTQCMVGSNETQHIKKFLKHVDTIPLVKKRGVFWLPTSLQVRVDPPPVRVAPPVLSVLSRLRQRRCQQGSSRRSAKRHLALKGNRWCRVALGSRPKST